MVYECEPAKEGTDAQQESESGQGLYLYNLAEKLLNQNGNLEREREREREIRRGKIPLKGQSKIGQKLSFKETNRAMPLQVDRYKLNIAYNHFVCFHSPVYRLNRRKQCTKMAIISWFPQWKMGYLNHV